MPCGIFITTCLLVQEACQCWYLVSLMTMVGSYHMFSHGGQMFDRDADGIVNEEDLHQLHLQARLPLTATGQDIKRTSWLGRQWRRRHTIDEEADIESNQRQWNFGRHTVVLGERAKQ